jgi:hypothetical protein
VLQSALRADAPSILSPFNRDSFRIFCEYFRAIECLEKLDERKIVAEWCSLKLPSDFVVHFLINEEINDFLSFYVVMRQLSYLSKIDNAVVHRCLDLFARTRNQMIYSPKCRFLLAQLDSLFDGDYIQFREKLTVFLSKSVGIGDVDVQQFVDSMKDETLKFQLTSRHCDAYLTIFETAFPVDSESSEKLFSILTSLVIDNSKMISRITSLTLRKSPEIEAFTVANILLKCATNICEIIVVLIEICRWLRQFNEKRQNLGIKISFCVESV